MPPECSLLPDTSDLDADGKSQRPPPVVLIWLARGLAAGALGIAVYLLGVSLLAEGKVAGCGGNTDFGCAPVLSSRWSRWLDVPVLVPALLSYVLVLAALFNIRSDEVSADQRGAWQILLTMAAMLAATACWFLGLQLVVLEGFCFYCVTAHVCGLLLAGFIFIYTPIRWRRMEDPESAGSAIHPAVALVLSLLGLAGTGSLIAGQILVAPPPPDMRVLEKPADDGAARTVVLVTADRPRIGSAQAKYVVVQLYDYTCPHCRVMDSYLAEARQRYGEQLAILPLVVPLHPGCNQYMQSLNPRKKYACTYARLALAVWRTNPGAFEKYHRLLLESTPTPEAARQRAAELLGAAELAQALADEGLARELQEHIRIYARFGGGQLPKLIHGKQIVEGEPASAQQLFKFLEEKVGLRPLGVHR